jgi:tripartite ATP-independent transporter DctM subunit
MEGSPGKGDSIIMDWWLPFIYIFGGLVILLGLGIPVGFAFLIINLLGTYFFMGGEGGLLTIALYVYDSLASFTLLPVPLFILMGEFLFNSEISKDALDVFDQWMGRIPGRLGLVTVAGGVLFAFLSGSAIASAAALGTLLLPEMTRRGYSRSLSMGCIMGSGQLAVIIPPSLLIVILGNLADISVAKLLVAGVIPGIFLAAIFASYIIIRCWVNTSLAPTFDVVRLPIYKKLMMTVHYLLPLGAVIFLVLGVIFFGIATPSEAAGLGAIGSMVLSMFYGKFSWKMLRKSLSGTARTSGTILIILSGSTTFSQVLSFTGASRGLVEAVKGLQLSPLSILIGMIVVWIILGCIIDQVSIMMISIPIFMPLARTLGFEPLWFGIIALITIEMGVKTPPFGLLLFVMKGVAPPDTTMKEIVQASIPFMTMDLICIGLLICFPIIVQWLPRLMG